VAGEPVRPPTTAETARLREWHAEAEAATTADCIDAITRAVRTMAGGRAGRPTSGELGLALTNAGLADRQVGAGTTFAGSNGRECIKGTFMEVIPRLWAEPLPSDGYCTPP
jgi:hypothetical protein